MYHHTDVARATRRATSDLARRLKVHQSEIAVQSVSRVTWPDASLGYPKPGRTYAQVLTTGYVILLSCGQSAYEYRSDGGRMLIYAGPEGLA